MGKAVDVVIVGGGIAGVSLAAALAESAEVLLLEAEPHPGYHATGRSAAFFAPAYGNASVRAVTALSEPFFREPPAGFADAPLLRPRPCVFIARPDQAAALASLRSEHPALQPLSAAAVRERVPILAPGYAEAGLLDESGGDLDVDAILQGFLRQLRHRGGRLETGRSVDALRWRGGRWELRAGEDRWQAAIVVNAAGAWADPLAELAGVGALGLQPMRRTAVLIDVPGGRDAAAWPMTVDAEEAFYFKPDAGALLLSPADETPSPPGDAQAEELDVALAVDRFERATGREVPRLRHRWAGLRTFAPDRSFVIGFDPRAEGFFWLAGQGGYGVQSAPGLARTAAALLLGQAPASGLDAALLAPHRLL